MEEYNRPAALSITPNPAQTTAYLRFNVEVGAECSVEIYSVLGQRVYCQTGLRTGDEGIQLRLDELTTGAYRLMVKAGSAVYSSQIVIRR